VVRLVVDVAGVGEVPAVAEPETSTGPEVGVGHDVPLVVDLSRTALLRPATRTGSTP
jgi:hypothetical protein